MSNRISPDLVKQIENQLAGTPYSEAEIASRFDVAPCVVEAIAYDSGNRNKPDPRIESPSDRFGPAFHREQPILSEGEQLLKRPVVCGACEFAIIVIPCRICAARTRRQETERPL